MTNSYGIKANDFEANSYGIKTEDFFEANSHGIKTKDFGIFCFDRLVQKKHGLIFATPPPRDLETQAAYRHRTTSKLVLPCPVTGRGGRVDHWRGVRRERTADKFLLSLASRGSAKVHTRTSVSRRLADRRHKIRRIVNQSEYRCKIGHHKTGTTQSIALYSARPLPAEYQRRAFRSIGNAHCDNFSSFSACLGQRALIVAFFQCIFCGSFSALLRQSTSKSASPCLRGELSFASAPSSTSFSLNFVNGSPRARLGVHFVHP